MEEGPGLSPAVERAVEEAVRFIPRFLESNEMEEHTCSLESF